MRRVILPAPITSENYCIVTSSVAHGCGGRAANMRLGRSAEDGPLSQKNGLVCVSQNWSTEQKLDQKSTPEQAPSIEGGGSRPTRDAPDPTTADAPDAGADGVCVTRGYFSGPDRFACLRQIHGRTAARSYSRLLSGSISLSLPAAFALSAQWRGSLWWTPMTPFSSRSMSKDKGRAREKSNSKGKYSAALPTGCKIFL